MDALWRRIGSVLVRRGWLVVGLVALATVVLGAGLTRMRFETSQASLISPESEVYQTNVRYQEAFGGEPMLVLWTGDIRQLFTPGNLAELRVIEEELRATGEFHAVLGPVTAMEFARDQLAVAPGLVLAAQERELAAAPDDAARAEIQARFAERLGTESARLAAAGDQVLENPAFAEFLLTEPDGSIRAGLTPTFPDGQNALLVARLPGNAAIADQAVGADIVKGIIERHPLEGFEALATGPPVLLQEINDYLQGGMVVLGALAAVVMVILLFAVFRARWRLLSLAVVPVGLVWSFGVLGYLDVPLSLVTISGLPILLGLGVDFAVQSHNRFEEEIRGGADGETAFVAVMNRMAGPLTIAMVAAVAGFLALQLSAVPMIDDFGVLLAVGLAVLVVEAIVVMTGMLLWRERRWPTVTGSASAPERIERVVTAATRLDPRWAVPVAAVCIGIGAAGLIVEGRTPIQTDPEAWVGDGSESVEQLVALRAGTGYSTELAFIVEADDVTTDEVVAWIDRYGDAQLGRHEVLVSANSFAGIVSDITGSTPTAADVEAVLAVAPPDVVDSFLSADRRSASILFPIPNLPLQEREELLDTMAAAVDPPDGTRATSSGLAVIGIELVNAMEANRQILTVTAIGLVALWLLLAYRHVALALLPLVPVVLAVGGSALAIHLLGLELTPLTTVSGPLAIAITTEFSVLMVSRFREERLKGAGPDLAVERGATAIGRAFMASGLTLLGGFVVLAFSPMPLLVDFGIIVAIDVAVALVSVLVVLPPLLRRTAGAPAAAPEPVTEIRVALAEQPVRDQEVLTP